MNVWTGIFWIILTVYHEARGESPLGQKNVTKVILNRAYLKGWSVEQVVKARKQFSCFNQGLDHPTVYIREIRAVAEVTNNVITAIKEWEEGNRLKGATHYYAPKGMPGGKPPYWVDGMEKIGKYGNHIFYREG